MVTARAIRVNDTEFPAYHAAPITIGRDESSDVRLDNDLVSRHHAELVIDERGWVFRDVSSTNGSFLDGRRVSQHVVDDDVQLALGDAYEGAIVVLQLVTASNTPTRIGDAPRAASVGPAVAPSLFVATHRVPASGMPTWDAPDPDRPSGPRLDPALEVMVTDTKGAWAHVICANGWAAWVDGRVLVAESSPSAAPSAPRGMAAFTVSPLLLGGVALVIVGGFLPWFTGSGVSVNAWDVPLGFVMVDPAESGAPYVGPFLLLALVAAAPLLWHRLPAAALLLGVAAVVTAPVVGAVNRVVGDDDGPDLGIGVVVTFAGALALLAEAWRTRSS